MNETQQRVPEDIPILTVCDREGDFYEFFSEAADLGANFLARIVQNRMADDGKKIFNELRSSPVAGSMAVRMSRNPKEHIPSGNVKMDYHCKEVMIHRPQRRREKLNLTYLGKICPEISGENVFDEEEWKVLYCCARKTKEIPETYSLKEVIYDLGILGGMKCAPSDGMPGA